MKKRNIKIYIDGAKLDEIKNFKEYDGFTFNPSLFKKLGAKDYLTFTKEIINETKGNKLIGLRLKGVHHERSEW